MRTVWDVAFVNLPPHKNKRGLVKPKWRAPRMMRWAAKGKHRVIGVAEMGGLSRSYVRAMPHMGVVMAKPNNVFGRDRRGNTLIYARWRYKRLQTRHLRVPWPGHPRGLNMVAVLLMDRVTKERCWFIVWHAPRKKLEPKVNVRVRIAVYRWALELVEKTGKSAATLGDSNNRRAITVARRAGFDVPVSPEVVMIASIDMTWFRDGADDVDFSDHFAIWARGVTD